MTPARCWTRLPSPVGTLTVIAGDDGISGLHMENEPRPVALPSDRPDPTAAGLREAVRQLDAYFAGDLLRFDLELAPQGTPFQRRMWSLLTEIPLGTTTTYAALARRLGRPTAQRAVGAANGRNPVSIIVPCHRVVGSDGSLTGYAGGLPVKRWLLDHEAGVAARLGGPG